MSKLLVIDSKNYETMYRSKLLTLEYDIKFVETLNEELSKDINTYDLVIVSHSLKNRNGIDVYNNLRTQGYIGNIVITCSKGEDILRPSYNGIAGIISKITNSEDFSMYIREVMAS